MSKYQPLEDHLKSLPNSHYTMSFKDIEDLIGDQLPPSAYRHRAWWSNNPSNSVITYAWLNAGWKSTDVDMEGKKLVFRRVRIDPKPPSPIGRALRDRVSDDAKLSLRLDRSTFQKLRTKAELSGRSVEDVAYDILRRHGVLSPEERVAEADRIRAMSPDLTDVDMVKLIREGREAR